MSTIVTFYSYKGGVGRSMALANVAVLMARRGLRVLAVDWDLEAPGLERYFSYYNQTAIASGGLLIYLDEVDHHTDDPECVSRYRNHVWKIDVDSGHSFDLLPSGRSTHFNYARLLEEFNWRDFFARGGGDFIERLRSRWREDYDFVLIDSRTGMSDSGGICTIQVPDVLVAIFTANHQSMSGVRDVIQAAQSGRQRLAYDRGPLMVLPVISRFSAYTEVQESNAWLDRAAELFASTCDDWLPPWVAVRDMFDQLKIPQVDWYGFGERLAVAEHGVSSPGSIGYALARMTDLLVSDFADLSSALGGIASKPEGWINPEKRSPRAEPGPGSLSASPVDDYEYDIFLSYQGGGVVDEWVQAFSDDLGEVLEPHLSARPRIFDASRDIRPGERWDTRIDSAMRQSKLLLALITPAYFASDFCLAEWDEFARREAATGTALLIIPVLLRGEVHDERLVSRQLIDAQGLDFIGNQSAVTKHPSVSKLGIFREYHRIISQLGATVAAALRTVPPYKSSDAAPPADRR